MVVCKCRKATRLYCFVHKVPVCGECICFPEHRICVVKQYSDWVVNGEYDWPPVCSLCHTVLEAGSDSLITRLGCLHLIHTSCLVSHIQSFSPQTAPAEYVCPACSTPIWPPKMIKDTGSSLHSKLKEAIFQSGLEKNVFGNHMVTLPVVEHRAAPAFASDPLVRATSVEDRERSGANTYNSINGASSSFRSAGKEEKYSNEVYSSTIRMDLPQLLEPDIVEIDVPSSLENQLIPNQGTNAVKSPGTTTRKGTFNVDRQNSEISYFADDEDGSHKKYTRRGPFRHKFLRLGPVAPRNNGERHRSQRPPQLGRSDALGFGDLIDLTDDNGDPDIIITGGRELSVPRNIFRHAPAVSRREESPPLFVPSPAPNIHRRLVLAHQHATMARMDRPGPVPAHDRFHQFINQIHDFQQNAPIQHMPAFMEYQNHAFVQRKPDHAPPPPAKEGFTRSPKEDDVIICPSCEEEMVHRKNEEEPLVKKGGKAPSRKEREEHPFWVVKECGHVFCNHCYQNRASAGKPNCKATFPETSKAGVRGKNTKVLGCAVEGCESDVKSKDKWVGVFL